jgi:hypothetical protein
VAIIILHVMRYIMSSALVMSKWLGIPVALLVASSA